MTCSTWGRPPTCAASRCGGARRSARANHRAHECAVSVAITTPMAHSCQGGAVRVGADEAPGLVVDPGDDRAHVQLAEPVRELLLVPRGRVPDAERAGE